MIKVSAGTACVLGLKKLRVNASPTTAYFMLGERCANNCSFCAQGRNSGAKEDMLSRVVWPRYSRHETFDFLSQAFDSGQLKRACLQVVHGSQSLEETIVVVKEIKEHSEIPICASAQINKPEDVEVLLENGVDKVCIALDAITPEIFHEVKGKDFHKRIKLLEECARIYPGKISTHLIVGLGETEYEMIKMIRWLKELQIITALFAFTPIKGTPLAEQPQPSIGHYRRIQAAHYLINEKKIKIDNMKFSQNKLTGIDTPGHDWQELIIADSGKAFRTTGCPDCNRPYYNESPQGTIYNYPRPLTKDEVINAIYQCDLG